MKLLTHNMLTSHVKGVKNGFPLRILVCTCYLIRVYQITVCVCVCVCVCVAGEEGGSERDSL